MIKVPYPECIRLSKGKPLYQTRFVGEIYIKSGISADKSFRAYAIYTATNGISSHNS